MSRAFMILLACSTITLASEPPTNLAHLKLADTAIEIAIADGQTPGAVLLVGRGDEIVHFKAYGHRSRGPDAPPMTSDTVFDLASMTKPFATATSIMILVERGQIDPHAPVATYIPEFAQNGKDRITVEQLLLHWGGLPAGNPMSDYADGPEIAMQRIYAVKPAAEPGEKFIYTDIGPIVLGELVRRVSGRPLDEFSRTEVFEPLRMRETMFAPLPQDLLERTAPTTPRDGTMMVGRVHDPRADALGGVAGHAGLFGTAEDASRYCRMLLRGGELDGTRILNESSVEQMTTLRRLPDGSGGRGYGFDIDTGFSSARGERFERGTTFGHTGYTGTLFWVDPKNDCYFILLTNRVHPDDKGDVRELRRRVATIVGEALLGRAP